MAGDLSIKDLRSALKGPFTVDFAAGACTAIAGPSGIGKSLFLRMIADLDPNTGDVRLGNRARDAMPAPHWRHLVTYVAAEPGWWAETVVEHMADAAAARHLLPAFGLDPGLLDKPVLQLSTGERERAALVRAVVARPAFLLLDEPTASLDPATKTMAEAALGRMAAEGLGLIVVTHDAEQAGRIAARRLTMTSAGLEETA